MIKGQCARNGCGSPDSDRSERWGALVTGVSQSALRAYRMWCPGKYPGTDRSSSELWLERSSRPDPGSGCTRRATSITTPRAPPDGFDNHKGLDKSPHRSSLYRLRLLRQSGPGSSKLGVTRRQRCRVGTPHWKVDRTPFKTADDVSTAAGDLGARKTKTHSAYVTGIPTRGARINPL